MAVEAQTFLCEEDHTTAGETEAEVYIHQALKSMRTHGDQQKSIRCLLSWNSSDDLFSGGHLLWI